MASPDLSSRKPLTLTFSPCACIDRGRRELKCPTFRIWPWETVPARLEEIDIACEVKMLHRCLTSFLACLLLGQVGVPLRAERPLHVRIDEMIDTASGKHSAAAISNDATFLRRVFLDFAGRIPKPDEVRSFLADKQPHKRQRIIDKLLASSEYATHMQQRFHVMLMERRGDDPQWQQFLAESFRTNKPWDELVRQIINPDAENERTRGAAYFYTKRLEKYGQNPTDFPGLTRDVGRLFLGRDLQCAQCHDHLFISDYRQVDFQGLYTVYLNVAIRRNVKFPAVQEKPHTMKLEFVSVFDPTKHQTAPRLPTGKEAALPVLKKKPAPKKKATPKKGEKVESGFRALEWLASELPRKDNPQFTGNIANRLWWMMMGRGLVHPLDLHHDENPPSHPQLLQMLSKEFADHKFDIKWYLRELALTKVYQRQSVFDGKLPPADRFLVAKQRRLSAEQLADSIIQATGPWRLKEEPSNTKAKDEDARTEPELIGEFRKSITAAIANPAREPEEEVRSTVKGALFFSNSQSFLRLLDPAPGNLVSRLAEKKDPRVIANELFLSILSRAPSADEGSYVAEMLKQSKDRAKSVGNIAWALLCSVEFYVNH